MAAARALYKGKPEVAAGFSDEDYEEDPIEVWPENLETINTFIAMRSQWRTGFSGPTGLEYASLPVVMRMTGVPRARWPEVFEGIQIMEEAALGQMRGVPPEDDDG